MRKNRRRGLLGKLVAAFAVLAAVLALGLGVAPRIAQAAGEASLGVPAHEKTITDNGDGTYTVSLNVTGATDSSSETVNKPVDIVLVVDQSSSMNDGNRMENVRNAAVQLANSVLADNEDGQVRISVVLFGTYTQDKYGNPKVGGSGWKTTAAAVANEIPTYAPNDQTGIFENGNGTNWEAGLREASNILGTARADADKYVIFLSDGEPTYRLEDASGHDTGMFESWAGRFFDRTTGERVYWVPGIFSEGYFSTSAIGDLGDGRRVDAANVEYVEGTGNTNPNGENSQAALPVAQEIAKNATFFSVSAERGTDALMKSFHQQVTGSAGGFYSAGDADSLDKAFEDITSTILRQAAYKNVTITDTLSQWVSGVTPEGTLTESGQVDPATFQYTKNGEAWQDAPAASVGQDGTITWSLGKDFQLEDGVTYSVSFKVAPNQDAFDDAAAKGQATEYSTNGSASVSYEVYKTVNGQPSGDPEPGTSPYDSPQVTVPVSTLTITKVWNGGDNIAKPDSVAVQVKQDNKDYGSPITLTAEGGWTANVTVPAGPEGHTYTISELDPGEGWATEGYEVNGESDNEVVLVGTSAMTAAFTVTNAPDTGSLAVSKAVTNSTGLTAPADTEFTFEVTIAGMMGEQQYVVTSADGSQATQTATFSEDGVATIKLLAGQTATFSGISDDVAWSAVEKDVPAGYVNVTKDAEPEGTVSAGETATASFTNDYRGFGLAIYKGVATAGPDGAVIADPDQPLSDAEFTIYADQACTQQVAQGSTGTDGKITLSPLGTGTYWFRETKVPIEYQLDGHLIQLVVNADGTATFTKYEQGNDGTWVPAGQSATKSANADGNFEYSLANERIASLPESGSSGTLVMGATGVATVTLAGAYLVGRLKKSN